MESVSQQLAEVVEVRDSLSQQLEVVTADGDKLRSLLQLSEEAHTAAEVSCALQACTCSIITGLTSAL